MRIPGIVDVYQVGAEWVARSWPKVQNQPNSAAQLYWRKRFSDAKAEIKTWTGAYLKAWQNIECPPGKMWIDIAMHSILTDPTPFDPAIHPRTQTYKLYSGSFAVGLLHYNYLLWASAPDAPWWNFLKLPRPFLGHNWQTIMKWNDDGWICPNGKRPKKKWELTTTAKMMGFFMESGFRTTLGPGSWIAVDDCPEGLALVGMTFEPIPSGYKIRIPMWQPPVYLKPEPWPF